MKPEQRIVIVGGGPAALSTARSYREAGGRAHVELICAGAAWAVAHPVP